MSLQSQQIPPVTREFILAMRKAFPGPRITRTASLDPHQVAWDSGAASVVEWAEKYMRSGTVSGDPELLIKPEAPMPWWRRLFSRRK